MTASNRTNWGELLERLNEVEKSLRDSESVSDEQRARILAERAAFLAAPGPAQQDSASALAVVIVRCGSERYALLVAELVEVIRQPKITAVPHAPAFVAGLMQVRGEIRPVYHLLSLLERAQAQSEMPAIVLLTIAGSAEFGIGVDAVEDLRNVPLSARVPTAVTPGHAGWMTTDLIPCLTADTLIPEQK